MIIDRQKLFGILSHFKTVLLENALIIDYKVILFSGKELIFYDDKNKITHPFETDFECLIPFDELYTFITKLKDKEIDMYLKKEKLYISAESAKLELKCLKIDMIPFGDSCPVKGWKHLPVDFKDGLLLGSIGADKLAGYNTIFNCLYFYDNKVVGTDNFKIGEYTFDVTFQKSFFLSLSSVDEILKLNTIFKKYILTDSWIYLKDKFGLIFATRLIDSEFPTYEKFFVLPKDKVKIIFPKDICDTIDISSLLFKRMYDRDKKLQIKVKKDKFLLLSENEYGKIETSLDHNQKYKEEFSFYIHPMFLINILKKGIDTGYYSMSKNIIIFSTENIKYVISLMIGDK